MARIVVAMMTNVPSANKEKRATFLRRLMRRWVSVESGIIITIYQPWGIKERTQTVGGDVENEVDDCCGSSGTAAFYYG